MAKSGSIHRTSALAVAAMLGASGSAWAGYDERDATRDCERRVVDRYGYQELRDLSTNHKGHDCFDVKGRLRVKHGSGRDFSCRLKHGEVVSVSGGEAAAIGADVPGLATIGAPAGSGDAGQDQKRAQFQSGAGAAEPRARPKSSSAPTSSWRPSMAAWRDSSGWRRPARSRARQGGAGQWPCSVAGSRVATNAGRRTSGALACRPPMPSGLTSSGRAMSTHGATMPDVSASIPSSSHVTVWTR